VAVTCPRAPERPKKLGDKGPREGGIRASTSKNSRFQHTTRTLSISDPIECTSLKNLAEPTKNRPLGKNGWSGSKTPGAKKDNKAFGWEALGGRNKSGAGRWPRPHTKGGESRGRAARGRGHHIHREMTEEGEGGSYLCATLVKEQLQVLGQ